MRRSRRAFVAGAAAVPAATLAQHRHAPLPGAPDPQGEFGAAMHQGMKAMMEAMEAAPMSGDPDRDFLAMMIPHHQGAIDMARLVLILWPRPSRAPARRGDHRRAAGGDRIDDISLTCSRKRDVSRPRGVPGAFRDARAINLP